ncbi:DUF389 domain-containing protein [Desulfocurvibacter africanus]|uniref:DUF389 domain-containing protein n=1 Tax=Desulfocurvibacter africanus TaxID=873 RepID=UPI0003FC227E|nr:DUF389 domain-containing protein [Desulfocurvibacter africanus]
MIRVVEITASAGKSDEIVRDIQGSLSVIGLKVERGISVQPPGDVITVQVTTQALHELMRLLDRHGIGQEAGGSWLTSQPMGLVSKEWEEEIPRGRTEASWEEMEMSLARESNMTVNSLLIMAISGVIAAVGILTNALHIVVGAMLIAPGFEPITRIAMGIVNRGGSWRLGLPHTAMGYAALVLGAAVTSLGLRLTGIDTPYEHSSYLPAGVLITYWTSISGPSLWVTITASIAGAVLVVIHRSVLTAGVMIALALVPSACLVGMGAAYGNWGLAGKGLLRWIVEAGVVLACSLLVFAWKQVSVYKRNSAIKIRRTAGSGGRG